MAQDENLEVFRRVSAGEPHEQLNGAAHGSLWFNPPMNDQDRPQLTRERIVTEALAVIAQDGVQP
jgi:hypothetical protein